MTTTEGNPDNGSSPIHPYNPFASEIRYLPPEIPPKSFVPLITLKIDMRDKLRRYQRRSRWLPGLIDHWVLPYPFPLEGEVATCLESQNPPCPTMDLVLQTEQSKNQFNPRIRVYRVQTDSFSPELVVKASPVSMENCRRNEAMSLALIRELTTIPVPRVVQVSQTVGRPDWAGSVYLATEYIHGRTLDECWHSLGILSKARIIWTLRDYVAQLRTLKRRAPGPLDKACAFEGYYFSEEGAGPFETYEEMIQWFNRAIEIGNRRPVGKKYDVSPFTASDRLVFCHQDLCLRNMLLGDDGVLYILDWEWAGFYPEWLEYAGMIRYEDLPWSFKFFVPFISGFFHSENMKRLCAAFWGIQFGYMYQ